MTSTATTPTAYVDSLTEDRKIAITELQKVIKKNLPKGFEETMQYGMLTYVVPHKLYPAGYHCKPTDALPFLSITSQKNSYCRVSHGNLCRQKTTRLVCGRIYET
jgi:hypothetical protein